MVNPHDGEDRAAARMHHEHRYHAVVIAQLLRTGFLIPSLEKARLVCIARVLGPQHGLPALRKAQDTVPYRSHAEADLNRERAWRPRRVRQPWRDETNQVRQ
jgi:hypothetical protein